MFNKILWSVFAILITINLAACTPNYLSQNETQGDLAKVIKVIDGDTFVVNTGAKIRLLSVNSPETGRDNQKAMPYGDAAKKFATISLLGKPIYLTYDVQKKDKYGRTLAYAFLENPDKGGNVENIMFNAILIKQGLAQTYASQPNTKYLNDLRKLQQEAKRQRIGMWSLDRYKDEVTSSQKVFVD